MNGTFRVVATPTFEREFRKLAKRNANLLDALKTLMAVFLKNRLALKLYAPPIAIDLRTPNGFLFGNPDVLNARHKCPVEAPM